MRTESFKELPAGTGVLLTTAAFVVVVAGMKAAEAILVPFLVAAFLALICGPPMFWLQRKGVPSAVALLIVVAVICGIAVGVGALVGSSFNDFTTALPTYQVRLQERIETLVVWMDELGIALPPNILSDVVNPGQIMQLVGRIVSGLGGLVANSFLITLTVVFILLEVSSFPAKLRAAFGDAHGAFGRFDEVADNVNRYLAIKTAISLATGVVISVWMAVIGVDFPLLGLAGVSVELCTQHWFNHRGGSGSAPRLDSVGARPGRPCGTWLPSGEPRDGQSGRAPLHGAWAGLVHPGGVSVVSLLGMGFRSRGNVAVGAFDHDGEDRARQPRGDALDRGSFGVGGSGRGRSRREIRDCPGNG